MNYKSLLLVALLSFTSSFSVFAEVVNLNKADASAFQYYLKGIGEKKAANIVNYRQTHQAFKNLAEIMKVRGIGKKIFTNIYEDLSLIDGKISAPLRKGERKKENDPVAEREKIDDSLVKSMNDNKEVIDKDNLNEEGKLKVGNDTLIEKEESIEKKTFKVKLKVEQ